MNDRLFRDCKKYTTKIELISLNKKEYEQKYALPEGIILSVSLPEKLQETNYVLLCYKDGNNIPVPIIKKNIAL